MSFPYTLSKQIEFNKSEYWIDDLPPDFQQLFEGAIKNMGYKREEGSFVSSHSLFSIPFRFDFTSEFSENKLIISYKLHLQNLVNGIIVILLLSAFISKFEFGTFLWFSFAISVAFYQLSLLIIHSGIRKQIYKILAAYKKVKNESDIETWVKENEKDCPACGARLGNTSLFCDECGLKIRQNSYSTPLNLNPNDLNKLGNNSTKHKDGNNNFPVNPEVNYHYKEKK